MKLFISDSCVLQPIDPSECGDDSWLDSLLDCYNDNLQHNDYCQSRVFYGDLDGTFAVDFSYVSYDYTFNTAICNSTREEEFVYKCIKGDI